MKRYSNQPLTNDSRRVDGADYLRPSKRLRSIEDCKEHASDLETTTFMKRTRYATLSSTEASFRFIKRRRGDELLSTPAGNGSPNSPRVDSYELASAFALASLALSPHRSNVGETQSPFIQSREEESDDNICDYSSRDASSPRADPILVSPASPRRGKRVHFAAHTQTRTIPKRQPGSQMVFSRELLYRQQQRRMLAHNARQARPPFWVPNHAGMLPPWHAAVPPAKHHTLPSQPVSQQWVCDVCNVAAFETFDAACKHEEICKSRSNEFKTAETAQLMHHHASHSEEAALGMHHHAPTTVDTAQVMHHHASHSEEAAPRMHHHASHSEEAAPRMHHHASHNIDATHAVHHRASQELEASPAIYHHAPKAVDATQAMHHQAKKEVQAASAMYRDDERSECTFDQSSEEVREELMDEIECVSSSRNAAAADDVCNGWYSGIAPLSAPSADSEWLSEANCYIRKHCVEAFSATAEDIARSSKRGRIVRYQVGIRCTFCASRPTEDKVIAAVSYPTSVSGIYESVKRWQRVHLHVCLDIPTEVKSTLHSLHHESAWVPTTRQYWADSAKALGMVDTNEGIRFERTPSVSKDWVPDTQKSLLEISPDATTTSSPINKKDTSQDDQYIALPCDEDMVPAYVYFLMRQVEPCQFTEADRFVARSKGPVGFAGFQCRHCAGHAGLGKYFPLNCKSLSTNSTSQNIHAHLLKCRKCPAHLKEELVQLKADKSKSARLVPGWRRAFFDRVWARLHCEGL